MNSTKTAPLTVLLTVLLLSAKDVSAYYDPGTQRWLNRDPLGDTTSLPVLTATWMRLESNAGAELTDDEFMAVGTRQNLNLHTFCLNGPLNFLDPLGLEEDEFPDMSDCPRASDSPKQRKEKISQSEQLGGRAPKAYRKPKSGLSAKEAAEDIPSWAEGQRPFVGENGKRFAKRVLDRQYGLNKWSNKGAGSEYSKLKKYCDRAFE
jgi:hypothetical protein